MRARPTPGSVSRFASFRWAVVAVAAALGVVLRVWVYRSEMGVPNSDEAVMGLMTRHIIDGRFPTFLWGVAYGGSQEAFLAVPGFLIAGSGWVQLRIVPMAFSGVAALILWRVGRRTIGEPAATAAGALMWIWPPFLIFQVVHETGFYASDVFYASLLMLLALRIDERPDRVRVGVFGLVLGLAFWQTSQIVPVAGGVIAWTVWRQPRALRHLWVAVPLAVVGALPWILWNATNGWESFSLRSGGDVSYLRSLRLFVSPVMPMLVGLRVPFSQEPLVPGALIALVIAAAAGLFLYGAYRTRRSTLSLLYVVAAVFPFVYATAAQTFNTRDPRYVVVLTPVVVLLIAQVLTTRPRIVAALALAAVTSVVVLQRMNAVPPEQPLAPRDLGPLVAALDRLGLDHVYANYWVAYVLAFDTRERIVAVETRYDDAAYVDGQVTTPDDPVVHSRAFERAVQGARHGFVFFRQEAATLPVIELLERHGYTRHTVGELVIFAPPAG